jgi:hypothetical protein
VDSLDVASLPAQPALEPSDGHVVESSSFPWRPVLLEFLPPLRPCLVIRVAPGPALRLRDVVEYFGVGSSVDEIPTEEVLLLVRSVHRRRQGSILLVPDEEDVGVEWNRCCDEPLSILL